MPGMKVFGRRWAVASDDFVFPVAADILLRVAWVIALSVILGMHSSALSTCTNGNLLRIYYIGMLAILPLEIIISYIIMYLSMQGTITNDEPRRRIPSLVVCKLFLFFLEIVWTIIGTMWAFGSRVEHCSHFVVDVVKGATIVCWVLLLVLVVGIIIVFDTLGSALPETPAQLQRLWKTRCKFICCCNSCSDIESTRSAAIDGIARMFAEHLIDMDFVITDIAAVLILFQRQQERELQQLKASGVFPQRISYMDAVNGRAKLDGDFYPRNWMTISYANAFMKYVLASYGWPMFIYDNHVCGLFKLLCSCRCCFCLRRTNNINGDNCCGCNMAAILEQTRVDVEDIFYVNFNNELYETPFYIIFDHRTKSVVLSVRGSLSFDDVLTDLSADLETMSVEGVPDAKAHKGILQAAKYIIGMNNEHRLLEEAFEKVEGYDLVVVGHSLGAGVAAILAILLKPKYPNLRCLAYSPPGWLLSSSLSQHAKEFVCSIVVGNDLVPRLGFPSLLRLKQKTLVLAHQSNEPKYQILAGSLWRTFFCCCDDLVSDDEDFDDENGVNVEPLLWSLLARKQNCTEEYEPKDQPQPHAVLKEPLFMPGIVLFLEELEPRRDCYETPVYRAFWMKPESFDEIVVSGVTMVHDHFPNVVYRALSSLVVCDSNMPADIKT